MIKIVNWTARRAGGRITINGVNAETGQPIKVVGVDSISSVTSLTPGAPRHPPVAIHMSGTQYELI